MNRRDFERGIRLAGLPVPDSDIKLIGSDPVYYSPFHLGEGVGGRSFQTDKIDGFQEVHSILVSR